MLNSLSSLLSSKIIENDGVWKECLSSVFSLHFGTQIVCGHSVLTVAVKQASLSVVGMTDEEAHAFLHI